jgi:hyperosmotically inducible protein
MKTEWCKRASIAGFALLGLTACDQTQEDRAATAASEAVRDTNEALKQAGKVAREGMREAGDLARDAGQVAREGTREAGQLLAQGGLTAKVKTALLADETVPGTRIDVDTQGNTVTLSGGLASQVEIDRALAIARGVEGVERVENRLTLRPAS